MIHIIDQATCERTPLAATLAADILRATPGSCEGRIVLLGRDEPARHAGLIADEVLPCPTDSLIGAVAVLKKWKGRNGPGRTVVCWSAMCERAARMALGSAWRIMPGGAHRMCDARRLDEGPGRTALRQRWGVGESQRVALLLCDDPADTDAAGAMVAVGLAGETGRPWRLLAHPACEGLAAAADVAAGMGHAERIITDPQAAVTWAVLAGCDAAIEVRPSRPVTASDYGAAGLAWAWAAMSGLPIRSEPAGEVGRMRELAAWLCRVYDDPQKAQQACEPERLEVLRRFDAAEARAVWQRLAGA